MDSSLTVAGLANLGNTCYFNAALQAMASSRHFTACIATLAQAFEATAAGDESLTLAQQLQATVRGVFRFLWEGPSDDPGPSTAQLTAQAAQGRLTQALHRVLTALQPQPLYDQQQRACVSAVHAGEVLSLLCWYVPHGVLEPGQQQDAAEALGLLCDAVATELTCWHLMHTHNNTHQQQQLLLQQGTAVGIKALLQQQQQHSQQGAAGEASCTSWSHADSPPSSWHYHTAQRQQQQQQQPFITPDSVSRAAAAVAAAANDIWPCQHGTAAVDHAANTTAAARDEQYRQVSRQQQQPAAATACGGGVVPQSPPVHVRCRCVVPQVLPVVGYCLDEITCLQCGHRFPCSATPFSVLPLSLPRSNTQGVAVAQGATLEGCLLDYSRQELLGGVECCRCSLAATLQQAEQQRAQPPGLQQQQCQQQEQHRAAEHQECASAGGGGGGVKADGSAHCWTCSSIGAASCGSSNCRGDHDSSDTAAGQGCPEATRPTTPSSSRSGAEQTAAACNGVSSTPPSHTQDSHVQHHQLAMPNLSLQGKHQQQLQHLPQLSQQQQMQQHVLELLQALCGSRQPLPPLDYTQLVQQQLHVTWRKARGPVTKRTLPGRTPAVLLLQLQRSTHVCGAGVKLQGHVRFPLTLDWRTVLTNAQRATAEAAAKLGMFQQQEDGGQQQQEQQQSVMGVSCGVYDLVSVVQHLGQGHSSGHYIMYRRLEMCPQATRSASSVPASSAQHEVLPDGVVANGGSSSVLMAQPGPPLQQHQCQGEEPEKVETGTKRCACKCCCSWVRVSDRSVMRVDVQEVLTCHATLLVYDRRLTQ